LYGSYRQPRELIWVFGTLIFLCLMAEAFMGYLLPWGQMSFWGAQVIVNLFSAIPLIGEPLSIWIRGDFRRRRRDAQPLLLVSRHRRAAGVAGPRRRAHPGPARSRLEQSGRRRDQEAQGRSRHPLDGIPFHPYYTVKDIVGVVVFLMVFSIIVFLRPEGGGYFLEYNNFLPADPLKTPPHIAPVWYFTPYYSLLRAMVWPLFGIDAKFWGVVAMGAGVVILAFLPWLDRSPVKSIRYRGPIFKTLLTLFVISFFLLGFLGTQPPSYAFFGVIPSAPVAQVLSAYYFLFFLTMPWWSKIDKYKPEPDRVTM
jgi:ubiquinol-cytochrome c reductase cytochrome b subunit